MKRTSKRKQKHAAAKSVLRLPDLEVAKSAVLNSLSCTDAQRGYRHALDEFVEWYWSKPRMSFSKTVAVRYRMHRESRHLAPVTINLRLGAVRRLAYEASDCGLLSADLVPGIRRVKGLKKLCARLGNWLTGQQAHALWQAPNRELLKGKRDRALLVLSLACGLRRHELAELTLGTSSVKGIGQSWTCWERLVTFEPFPSQIGSTGCLRNGQTLRVLNPKSSFGGSEAPVEFGAKL